MASVVVVGGGVAGLACAWRLRRAGHEVEVLEREVEAGGSLRPETRSDFRIDRGEPFLGRGDRNLHAVVRALGLAERLRPVPRPSHAILCQGRLHPVSPLRLLATGPLAPRDRARLATLAVDGLRLRRVDPLRPETAVAFDRTDAASEARRRVGEEGLEVAVAPALAATFGAEPEELSGACVSIALRLLAGGNRLDSLAGGIGQLVRGLAERVPVRTRCEAVAVETQTQGARVRYRIGTREHSVLADAAVLALPGDRVAALCRKLTPEERGFFESVAYRGGIAVDLLFERAPAIRAPGRVAFPRREGLDLESLTLHPPEPGAAPAGAGRARAALTGRAAARLWDASDEALAARVVDELARTPVGRLDPAYGVVQRRRAAFPRFGVGQPSRLARFVRRIERSPRLAFAGDYLTGVRLEAVLTSGMRAATEIARQL